MVSATRGTEREHRTHAKQMNWSVFRAYTASRAITNWNTLQEGEGVAVT